MIDFFGALRRGDFDAAAGLLDPDITWQGLREDWVCQDSTSLSATVAGLPSGSARCAPTPRYGTWPTLDAGLISTGRRRGARWGLAHRDPRLAKAR
jgi:hypothetical protein